MKEKILCLLRIAGQDGIALDVLMRVLRIDPQNRSAVRRLDNAVAQLQAAQLIVSDGGTQHGVPTFFSVDGREAVAYEADQRLVGLLTVADDTPVSLDPGVATTGAMLSIAATLGAIERRLLSLEETLLLISSAQIKDKESANVSD